MELKLPTQQPLNSKWKRPIYMGGKYIRHKWANATYSLKPMRPKFSLNEQILRTIAVWIIYLFVG